MDWAHLQQDCLQRNADRYRTTKPEKKVWTLDKEMDRAVRVSNYSDDDPLPGVQPRTAVILRTWIDMEYSEDMIYAIRSMIMELSLHSGGEYAVTLLVDCKNAKLPSVYDTAALEEFSATHLPREFHGLAVFFNEEMLQDWYPDISVHTYRSSRCWF